MRLEVDKRKRKLTLFQQNDQILFQCAVALGSQPDGPKNREGDGRTPEGEYYICLKKRGKYGPSLGISYPNGMDARRNGAGEELITCIEQRAEQKERPPWGSFLGGEIFIHGGGTASDWTAGCIALSDEDAEMLFALVPNGTFVKIF